MSSRPSLVANNKLNLEKLVVMVVDDNPQGLEILSQVVAGFGVRSLVRCESGETAREQLARSSFDLIISDAQMPGLDGFELTQWLRREAPEQNRFAPVILITSHTRKGDVARARDCGAHYLITKPLRPKTILERIFWIAREDRVFVEVEGYAGPDRRFRRAGPPAGMAGRRSDDVSASLGEATTPNLSQDQINAMMKPAKVSL
jgi:CheY-like chemotaxis protein